MMTLVLLSCFLAVTSSTNTDNSTALAVQNPKFTCDGPCEYCDNTPYETSEEFNFVCGQGSRLRFKFQSISGCTTQVFMGCCPEGSPCTISSLRGQDNLICEISPENPTCFGDRFCEIGTFLAASVDACDFLVGSYEFVLQDVGPNDANQVSIEVDTDTGLVSYQTYNPSLVLGVGVEVDSALVFADSVFCALDNLKLELSKEFGLTELCLPEVQIMCQTADVAIDIAKETVKCAVNAVTTIIKGLVQKQTCQRGQVLDKATSAITDKLFKTVLGTSVVGKVDDLCKIICQDGPQLEIDFADKCASSSTSQLANVLGLVVVALAFYAW